MEYHLLLAPGLTHLGLFPEYNVEQLTGFVRELRRQGVSVELVGRSRERRPIWMINFKSPNPKAMPFFIQARDHAYETAGSYSAEGVARFLAADDPMARYLREKFSVHIMPMTNPDGVYNGMSQRRNAARAWIKCSTYDSALKQSSEWWTGSSPACILLSITGR